MITLFVAVFAVSSVITFMSYQAIPNALDRTDDVGKVTETSLFTVFIRACGFDHMVMMLAMLGMMAGFVSPLLGWGAIAVSSAFVALVSLMSCVTIRAAAK